MVTVQTCSSLVEAQMTQSVLGGSGIKAFLPDEFTAQNTWVSVDGVRVQVEEEFAERAREILANRES
jgi:Putative prokaryotic signal transducing protein